MLPAESFIASSQPLHKITAMMWGDDLHQIFARRRNKIKSNIKYNDKNQLNSPTDTNDEAY
jgi:hypothetical protein